jgi:hypothetical protein
VLFNKPLKRHRQLITGKIKPPPDLAGNVFRRIFGPTFRSVDGA